MLLPDLFFTQNLMAWHNPAARPMPWKNERDPYRIWLSEIILQQTRVEQGLPYFLKFMAAFPTVRDLAEADENEVFKLWEGLGYYSRARNLQAAARRICNESNGSFPTTYDEILKLPGIGPYTAAAIASFAFGLPHAVLDGNVYRVLARFFGIKTPVDSIVGRKIFTQKAAELLDRSQPGRYNQAIMDFGATVCTPQKTACATCPLHANCLAFHEKAVADLPVKSRATAKRMRFFHYFIFKNADKTWVRKRAEKDIWRGLFEFPMVELKQLEAGRAELLKLAIDHFFSKKMAAEPDFLQKIRLEKTSEICRQTLSHQQIVAILCEINLPDDCSPEGSENIQTKQIDLKNMAFPRLVDLFMQKGNLFLTLF